MARKEIPTSEILLCVFNSGMANSASLCSSCIWQVLGLLCWESWKEFAKVKFKGQV
jgi:hypothetical protein